MLSYFENQFQTRPARFAVLSGLVYCLSLARGGDGFVQRSAAHRR